MEMINCVYSEIHSLSHVCNKERESAESTGAKRAAVWLRDSKYVT